jgi:hypothetical protein
VLPKIFKWAGFDEVHMFDINHFGSMGDDPDVKYRPEFPPNREGPIYAALIKSQK